MRRVDPRLLAAAAIGILVILAAVVMLSRRGNAAKEGLPDNQTAEAAASGPERRCGSQATYDRVKDELFRKAADLRQSDQAAFDSISAYASVRMARPLLRSHDAELGTVRCTGLLSLDLPPGVAVVGGRRTLSADIDYVLQPAADGSGDVVILEGADPIVVPLATLARTGQTAPAPTVPPEPDAGLDLQDPLSEPGSTEPEATVPPPEPAPAAGNARPSFNCRYARTRGEIAVCRDAGLAALDRQMARQYYRAIAAADRQRRGVLTATRDSFLRYRDRCRNDACIAETYRGRMREIRDIMSGDWRPRQ